MPSDLVERMSMRYYLMTNHTAFVALDGGALSQIHAAESGDFITIDVDPDVSTVQIVSGPLAGFTLKRMGQNTASFERDGNYLCASEGVTSLSVDRGECQSWETFHFASAGQFDRMKAFHIGLEDERKRLRQRVAQLQASGNEIKIYCGCGTVPRDGFLNFDIRVFAPEFALENPDDYFIFNFGDSRWPLADDSVDFIFDEDFIEHIDQIMQMQYLAETRRVLKRGHYHRISTPNLIAAMKRHSNFEAGAEGVYTGEREHEHIALFSPWSLKEISDLVGYREIVFETRDVSVSGYTVRDTRPWSDRDSILGNIYAELLK
jgi:hypothetical protein